MTVVAGVELGGTKCIAVLARGREILREERIATAPPAETLPAVAAILARWSEEEPPAALGIAAFGPLDLSAGRVARTVKPGWSGADVTGAFAALALPTALDTDVNAAALAEVRWGAGRGCESLVYLTIGTGVGGGLVVNGRTVHGASHPEIGHDRFRRAPGDPFPGVCAFHADCVEGLVSGPALAARLGSKARDYDPSDTVWGYAAHDLGQLFATLILTLSPERILVGGGVGMGQPAFVQAAAREAAAALGGYGEGADPDAVVARIGAPALGHEAGPLGAIALALSALEG